MALQIKGKFVENAAIDGDKIELKSGQSLKQKKADGTTAELIKLDESLTTGSKVRVNGEQVATQSQIDGISTQVSTQVQSVLQAETAARVAADTALDARLDIIEGADTVEGSVAKAEKDAKDYADAAVLVEKNRAEAAEGALSVAITAEATARIDGDAATLSAAKDYVERLLGVSDSVSISQLANLQTWLQDNDEATGVITALAAVEARVDTAESGISSLEGRMTTAESDITAVESALAAETSAREAEDLTFLKLDGTRAMTGDLSMGTKKITNLANPVNAQDAATKQFVLDQVALKDQASEISVAPAGSIAATTVQAAIEELDSEKLALAGGTMTGDLLVETGHQIKIGSDIYNYNQQSVSATTIYNEDSTNSNVWNQLDLYASQISLTSSTETGRDSESILRSKSLDLYERDSTTYEKSFRLQAKPELVKLESQNGIKLHGGVSLFAFDPAFIPASDVAFVPTLPEHAVTKAYVDGLNKKDKFVLTQVDLDAGYIELDHEALPSSIVASVGRLMIHEGVGEDFTVSVVAGKTRMTFVGNLVNPSPEELGVGDVIYVKYMA